MALGRRKKFEVDDNTELEMVPIMNMFLVLIPFLLLSASFFHIKAINTSVPVLAESVGIPDSSVVKKSNTKVTVIVELREESINITAMSDDLKYDDLIRLGSKIKLKKGSGYPLDKIGVHLQYVKKQYPKSDTIILVPGEETEYGTIIETMDIARAVNNTELFPNVVLSAKVG